MVVALSAAFIGLCALFATLYQASLERQTQHLSVWPRLEFQFHTGAESPFSLSIANKGIGPAIVHDLRVHFDGSPVSTWQSLVEDIGSELTSTISINTIEGSIVSAEEAIALFEIQPGEAAVEFRENYQRIKVEVCYCSVFEDCWLLDSEDKFLQVDVCIEPESESFHENNMG